MKARFMRAVVPGLCLVAAKMIIVPASSIIPGLAFFGFPVRKGYSHWYRIFPFLIH